MIMKDEKERGQVTDKCQSGESGGITGSEAGEQPDSKAKSRQCESVKKDGSPCRLKAMSGRSWCWYHDPDLAAERREAGRRGWAVSNRRSIEGADLSRLRTPRTVDDVVRALAGTARAVMAGTLTPGQAKEVTACLNSILKARTDEATLGELKRLTELLEDHGQGAERLLAALDGGQHE